ncbi:hypothetical protein [Aquimonas sp.]|jgi:hypothetical protein|uniref:hypothetical protein n=1 Tax=Aquimonas sp. TaxID=1872588 RepID=UPI0037BF7FB3
MRMRKRGAFRNEDVVLDALEPWLAAAGFDRSGHLFHRCRDSGTTHERIEAVAVCLGNSCRTVWLHVSTKFPAAIELLSEVRPFTFQRAHARSVPGYLSDLACQLQLRHFPRLSDEALAPGVRQRHDGRLQRQRTSAAEVITTVLQQLTAACALPAFEQRLTLERVAQVAEHPGYGDLYHAACWPIAARLLLGDVEGAGRAFAANPLALARNESEFDTAMCWLRGKGADVDDCAWSAQSAARVWELPQPYWLDGELV